MLLFFLYYCPIFALFLIYKIIDTAAYNIVGFVATKKSRIRLFVIDAIFAFLLLCFGVFLSELVFSKLEELLSMDILLLSHLLIPMVSAGLLFLLSTFVERKTIIIGTAKIPVSITLSSLFGISAFVAVYFLGSFYIALYYAFGHLFSTPSVIEVLTPFILFAVVIVVSFCFVKFFLNKRWLVKVSHIGN